MNVVAAQRERPLGWWGMLFLVATEATLFGVLLASYYYLRFEAGPTWPPEGIPEPKVVKNLWINAVLVASSVPMLLAPRTILAGARAATTLWLAAAFALGAVFLGLQAHELELSSREFTPQDHAYGSLFYTIVVGHAAHAFAGLLLNVWCAFLVWGSTVGRKTRVAIGASALYWHFVNALAVVVYLTIVLVPGL